MAAKDNTRGIWKLTIIWTVFHFVYLGLWALYYTIDDSDTDSKNWFALSAYLLPIGWVPCFAIGVGKCEMPKFPLKSKYATENRSDLTCIFFPFSCVFQRHISSSDITVLILENMLKGGESLQMLSLYFCLLGT